MAIANTFFISGTDTDVGKTIVSAGLLEAANRQGLTTYGLKPVAAGCYEVDGGLRNEDADLLMAHSSVGLSYSQVNPIALKSAIAPHIAAQQEGRSLSLNRLEGFCRGALMTRADFRVIEGAGGWRTPLNSRELMSGLVQSLNVSTILVVGVRLGCLNHAMLTAEAIINDNVQLAGWVANIVDPEMPSLEENIQTLQHFLPAPLLGVVPWMKPLNIAKVADCLCLDDLIAARNEST